MPFSRGRRRLSLFASILVGSLCTGTVFMRDAAAELSPGAIDGNAVEFFSAARLARLPAAARAEWKQYLARSARLSALDKKSMATELQKTGKAEMTPAPYAKGFHLDASMTEAWFRSADARRIGQYLLSYQTPSGGWSKRVDMLQHPRAPGESYYSENTHWDYIATLDNDSTSQQLRFLAGLLQAQPDAQTALGFRRGIDYVLQSQLPSGCFPQVYPLRGGYHDAATFNDDATVNALRLLQETAEGAFPSASPLQRTLARHSVARGIACILAAQVRVGGTLTLWAQQHDPLDLTPVPARSYELVGLAGRESASILSFLMAQPRPSAALIHSVDAGVAWFRAHRIFGWEYDVLTGLRPAPNADPLWARLSEIETGFPLFSNRDGIKLYDWNQLTDRRQGYAWFGQEPAKALAAYDTWARQHH
ncbi:MAG TPA: pectate lyase [Polyangiaceae bacterium]|nr:pectate lyase [Polyangiaceae bacterium]